jgi:RNA polymerase sigma-70 factor, ECF subfamily
LPAANSVVDIGSKKILKNPNTFISNTRLVIYTLQKHLLTRDLLDIINGCKNQDRLMQKALYQHCYKEMMKLCYRYTNDLEISASIYNDAMIKVFSNIGTYKEDGKLVGWVKRIVVNTCIDHVRKKVPMQMKELKEDHNSDAIIENGVFTKMSNAEVKRLIGRLPANAALVFNLYVYEEYNHNEIAALLKIPGGTSRYWLSEARRLLKEVVANNIHSLNKI